MSSSNATTATETEERPALLDRQSYLELDARGRAHSLLDVGTGRELCGPFDRVESPWLQPQGLVPQADDGVVVVKGTLAGEPCVVIGIEQKFQGGAIGEVSGAKAACALQLAARDAHAGQAVSAVLLLETGGVRLQEANLGLNAVAEVLSAILELRGLRPVIGVAAGPLGSFGGMSIGAGLCTRMVMTHEGRLGLNGPEVIESEAGVAEFDSSDRALIWSVDGGEQRYATGLADALVLDDVSAVRDAVIAAVAAGIPRQHRSEQLDVLDDLLSRDGVASVQPEDLRSGGRARFSLTDLGIAPAPSPGAGALTASELGSQQHRGAVS
jgi:malonate decarboxylase beta subunit